ncbi:unnamed protein product [Parnassius apollo]|uniref:(apollo) hypothetical protein n=1 Tax=Parnassius apollo TaxID=110799 RepID=A0A8S3X9Y9_PARAO|nr:unnamed protein product [Parnassius apollo]
MKERRPHLRTLNQFIPIDTALLTKPCNMQQIENDLYMSSSDQNLIDDSDTDPSYVRQKKKKLPPKTQNQDIVNEGRNGHPSKNNNDQPDEDRNGQPNEDCNDQPHEDCNNQPNEEAKKGKKRLRRESTWKVNICKVLRNSGKAYQSLSKTKKLVRERKVRTTCGEKCRLRCNLKKIRVC